MKKGDLVICKSVFSSLWYGFLTGHKKPILNTVYTVRKVIYDIKGQKGIYLVELKNKKHRFTTLWPFILSYKNETAYCKTGFKKIKFNPSEIETLLQTPARQ